MSTNNTVVVAVRQVLLHLNSHLDEFLAYLLLRLFGEKMFPGISNACLRYVQSDIAGSEVDHDREGILPIGCGGGRFDEHRGPNERLPGECATTLVAKFLVVGKELDGLIQEVLMCDTKSGCTPTMMAEVIKAANRQNRQNGTNLVLNWALKGLDATIIQERYHYAPVLGEKSLLEIYEIIIKDCSYVDNPKVDRYLRKQINASTQNKDKALTELAHIVEALFRRGYKMDDVINWVDFAVRVICFDQEEFQEQVEILRNMAPIGVKMTCPGGGNRTLNLVVCESDSTQAPKAARYLGADLVILRQSSGNVQIFSDNKIDGLNFDNVVRMIRWLELSAKMKNTVDWNGLGREGKHQDIDQWYYFRRGGMIFNGSETHRVQPTKISTQALIEVLKYGLTPGGVRAWCQARGINTESTDQADAKSGAQSNHVQTIGQPIPELEEVFAK